MSAILDLEVLGQDPAIILANAPAWDEEEAKTRTPKNYKSPEAISGWIEKDKADYEKNLLEKAALNPETATVAIVGIWKKGEVKQFVIGGMNNENGIITGGLEVIEESILYGHLLGWNIVGYDLKMLVRRAWILGIKVPKMVYNPLSRYPVSDKVIDMMERYKAGSYRDPHTSLNNALKAVGLPGKPDGKEFAQMWATDKEKALAYSKEELLSQSALYRRMGVDL